ncbi:3-hydroxyacyl-CoA dehydrogenase NAD-binding domain-containing protein [Novosphingobium decolorationis]|uniref:Enoyl-CoA hydratase/isomerase family protein n=1 Tax=Novosphingobium decolorationis TaxID=2698673 RepID=A0ABX8E156_9SPHN|nr:3-hydroxyacyl-CoA dehydrogenase NAD-binding domain-containing protein [Novosphingobium decolorationis]QVM82615.1 enoyl-CoA hydratase/isomerase family protein [Novosphingobium decolorationis]
MTTIHTSLDEAGIALWQVDVPGHAFNVLTPEFFEDLDRAIDDVAANPAVRGVILTSGKASGFMAGADVEQILDMQAGGLTPAQGAAWAIANGSVLRKLETCGKPVVAAINGLALGGGLELALACHRRVLLARADIAIGLPEVTLGLLPGAGGTQRLARMLGIEKALPLLLEGRRLDPAKAHATGIVEDLEDSEEALLARAREWLLAGPAGVQPWDVKGYQIPGGAGPLAPHAARSFQARASQLRARQGRYPAPIAILSAVYEGTQVAMDVGLKIEAKYFGTLIGGKVSGNLVRAFLRQNRARKRDLAASGHEPLEVGRLGVIGAGMMGAGIANVAAGAGIDVVLLDTSAEAAQRAQDHAARLRAKEVERGQRSEESAREIVARIRPTADPAGLSGTDLIIEAVFEDRDIKGAVYKDALAGLAPGGVLASNTSTLSIGSLAQGLPDPYRFIGMHFFSPVERMPLVEIIAGPETSPATMADAFALAGRLRKTPILVHDSPGFYTSRVFCTYIDEAMAMLREGVSPALIENAAREAGFPAPPLAVTDEVSLDLQKRVIEQAQRDGLDARFLRAHAEPVVEAMNARGRLGRKTGGGFYTFTDEGKHLWEGLADLFPLAESQPAADDVAKRLLYIQALESARCLAEGVIDDEASADLGSVLGIGFPAWTGGALSLISTVGVDAFVADCTRFADRAGPRFHPDPAAIEAVRTEAERVRQVRPVLAGEDA